MASSSLVLHTGGKLVTLDELREYRAPSPEGRWHPISHDTVLGTVKETLGEAGYEVRSEKLALNGKGTRFFGTLDLATPIATGVTLAVGIRNSTDKSYAELKVMLSWVGMCFSLCQIGFFFQRITRLNHCRVRFKGLDECPGLDRQHFRRQHNTGRRFRTRIKRK